MSIPKAYVIRNSKDEPCKEVWKGCGFAESYSSIAAQMVAGTLYLLCYDSRSGDCELFKLNGLESPTKIGAKISIGKGVDAIDTFMLANAPYILCYATKPGVFTIFGLKDDLTLSEPYAYTRYVEPGITAGFSTIRVQLWNNSPFIMGYNFDNGHVAIYTIGSTATSDPGTPPIVVHNVWSHIWAVGWTRFAYFQFAGEVFFLKTNTWHPNVNIDHVLDGLSGGTIEVATHMALTDAQELENVTSVVLEEAHPYFLAYLKSGSVTLYRFRADGQGWTPIGSAQVTSNMAKAASVQTAQGPVVIWY